MARNHFIEVKNLVKNYGTGNIKVTAVDNVSFYVDKGAFIGIMGASGSGKTTILNILSTIDRMSGGQVLYDMADISQMTEEELSDFRQENLGFVFQDYNLLDTLSIEENIMLPMALCGRKKEEIESRVKSISETLHICDILSKFPYEVSGGQKQRAACARALVNNPKLILADEPTGALDSNSSTMLLHTLQIMNRELGATILMVTHDVFSACYCEKILFLSDGKICSELERGNMGKKEYLNRILDMQSKIGGVMIFMLNKLALRNARRLWKDYLNYFLTLCMITALIFSFHSLLFSKDIYEMIHFGNNGELSTAGTMLVTFMAVSTAAILIIVAWLINYMTRFILEKRSREFAIYLLSGMKKKQIAALYMKENFYLGISALFAGLLLGSGLQQILFYVFYKSIGKNYRVNIEISAGSILLTIILYGACFMIALFRNKKKFSNMEIISLINMDRQNETVNEKRNAVWKWLFYLSIGNVLFLYFLIFTGRITKWAAVFEMIGLAFTFYFFYLGLSAFLMKYIKSKGSLIYKKDCLFLMRQFSSKMRNTCFVLGTLSLLFMFALVGSSLAFMLSDYQNKQLNVEYPFDIIMISDNTENDFAKEETLINENTVPRATLKYCVYQNGTSEMVDYLYQNLRLFSDKDSDPAMAEGRKAAAYYDYDVYMGITDYNSLRKMLGLTPVVLQDNQYVIHMPNRVYQEIKDRSEKPQNSLHIGLDFAGFMTEGFAQNGHNGTDFLLIVPDKRLAGMKKYFSLMAVMASGNVPENLSESLYESAEKIRGYDELADYIKIGSEELFLMPATIQVKSREVLELKFLMSTLSFPLFFIGLVFLCVAFTVLSVQQLSDSNKYKFRYQILNKLGMGKKKIGNVVAKQLFLYYLCPVILSVIISAVFILYVGRQFVIYTGIHTEWILYFGISFVSFLGIYVLYFAVTYFQFNKNIEP